MLFVVGVGNAGKSSLINALAGRKIAPQSIQPLTWKIDAYEPADSSRAVLRWDNGRESEHGVAEAEALCQAEERAALEADQRGELYQGRILEARWRVAETLLPTQLQIVDTPGLHQIRSNLRDDEAAKKYRPLVGAAPDLLGLAEVYFHRADAVLWLFDATALDDVSARAATTLRAFDRDQYAVINKIDLLTGVSEEEIVEHAQGKVGEDFTRFFAVSAKRAMKSPDEWGMPALRQFIQTNFMQSARLRKLNSTSRLTNAALGAAHRVAEAESARLMRANADFVSACRMIEAGCLKTGTYHSKKLANAIESAFERACGQVDESFANQLASMSDEDARNALFRRRIPLQECAQLLEAEVRTALAALRSDAGVQMGRLRFQEGRYDFAGNQAAEAVPIFRQPGRVGGLTKGMGGAFSISDLNALSGEAVFGGGIIAIGAALLLGPLGLLFGLLGGIFGPSKEERIRRRIREAGQQVKEAATTQLSDSIEAELQAILEHAADHFRAALGYTPDGAATRSDELSRRAQLLSEAVVSGSEGTWQSALARSLAA
ncbi:MAG: dynamin family protein [Myxococcales bacterium]|nr:dynamin family protein [Myxococcales bacterium]